MRQLDSGRVGWEPFDQLLIATGASPFRPDVPGADAQGIYGLGTLQSGIEVRKAIDEAAPQRAVIVGGGYIGLEMAEALVLRGLEVSLVEKMPQVMGTLDPDMGALVSDALRKIGVTLYLEESLQSFDVEPWPRPGGGHRSAHAARRSGDPGTGGAPQRSAGRRGRDAAGRKGGHQGQ